VPEYTVDEGRDWALERMKGVCGCLMPTFNTSLTRINEAAIRHDVRLEKELGFWGTLLVSECGTSDQEMREVIDIAVDEASAVGLRTALLGSFPTVESTVEMVSYAESAGCDFVLLAYPINFFPRSEQEVVEYTKAIAAGSDLGIMLFAINQWNFDRFHPSGFSPDLIERLVREVPSVIAIKNEVGGPGVGGLAHIFERYAGELLVTDPFERNSPAWVLGHGMQFMGTSNYEAFGGAVVEYFDLLQAGKTEEAMAIYWQVHPIRQADAALATQYMPGAGIVHRQLWKYQYWLNGFNGGPIRQPQLRLKTSQMKAMRAALEASGYTLPSQADDAFYLGRNPEE
jgi:dihydrodipicolinate synthase/N-acetylneuraminate lyase